MMASRYQQLEIEFGGEEVAAESLKEALRFARRAVERGDKVTHPDVLMLLDLFEMESGHEPEPVEQVQESSSERREAKNRLFGTVYGRSNEEAMRLREQLRVMETFHKEGANLLQQRIAQLEEEVRIRSNALTTRISQVAGLQSTVDGAGKKIEELSREARDWEQRWQLVTDTAGELQKDNQKLREEVRRLREESRAQRIAQMAQWAAGNPTVGKFGNVVSDSIPFFARKNREYGNAIESTGVRGSVVALTGDVARLRVMLKEPMLDVANIRDKLQDVLVQAGIGIVLLDAGNVDGKGV